MCELGDFTTLVSMAVTLAVSLLAGAQANQWTYALILRAWTNPDVLRVWKQHIARMASLVMGVVVWGALWAFLLSGARSALCG